MLVIKIDKNDAAKIRIKTSPTLQAENSRLFKYLTEHSISDKLNFKRRLWTRDSTVGINAVVALYLEE